MLVRSMIAAVLLVAVTPLSAVAEGKPTPTSSPTPRVSTSPGAPLVDETPDPSAEAIGAIVRTALKYETTVKVAEGLQQEAAEKRRVAKVAEDKAEVISASVVDFMLSPEGDPFASKLQVVQNATGPDDLINGFVIADQVKDLQGARLHEAQLAHEEAGRLLDAAKSAELRAEQAGKRAQTLMDRMGSEANALGFGSSTTPTGLPGTHGEQVSWNKAAAKRWKTYKERLDAAVEKVPGAKKLRADRLPAGLSEVLVGSDRVRGVATANDADGKVMKVLPKQTIKFVDTVLSRVGDPYTATGAEGRWTCSTLVDDIEGGYGLKGTPAELYASTVQVPAGSKQIGDLIFESNETSGVHHVGVYVGSGQMVDASGNRYEVGVSEVPEEPFAVTRPSLGPGNNVAPVGSLKKPNTVCGADVPTKVKGWRFPMKRGSYTLTATWGEVSSHWATIHTGQDFAAPTGTAIYASRPGVVTLTDVAWAGTLITVSHPDGTAERYAHTSKQFVADGDQVEAGDEIAEVGARGNVTGPHLHFEVFQNGESVDPMPLLVKYLPTTGGQYAWGGYGNGQIPLPVLCTVSSMHLFRCDAAKDYRKLAGDFKDEFDKDLPLGETYKTVVDQIDIGEDGKLVDLPGTSPFGWGTRFSADGLTEAEEAWINNHSQAHGWKASGPHQWVYTAR